MHWSAIMAHPHGRSEMVTSAPKHQTVVVCVAQMIEPRWCNYHWEPQGDIDMANCYCITDNSFGTTETGVDV